MSINIHPVGYSEPILNLANVNFFRFMKSIGLVVEEYCGTIDPVVLMEAVEAEGWRWGSVQYAGRVVSICEAALANGVMVQWG